MSRLLGCWGITSVSCYMMHSKGKLVARLILVGEGWHAFDADMRPFRSAPYKTSRIAMVAVERRLGGAA